MFNTAVGGLVQCMMGSGRRCGYFRCSWSCSALVRGDEGGMVPKSDTSSTSGVRSIDVIESFTPDPRRRRIGGRCRREKDGRRPTPMSSSVSLSPVDDGAAEGMGEMSGIAMCVSVKSPMSSSSSSSSWSSAAESSAMCGTIARSGDFSKHILPVDVASETEREPLEEYVCSVCSGVGSEGVMSGESGDGLQLPMLAVESRCESVEPEVDASESFDARLLRDAEMNMSVSCSEMGDGPGTGGSGDVGGRERGG